MPRTLRIRNWEKHFETFESRRIRQTTWVPFPVKHDGKGFRRLMAMRRGFENYAAWVLIVQVAAKCPVRGTLADGDGPLTPADLAVKTGGPAGIFERAIDPLMSIGWLEYTDVTVDATGAPADSPVANVCDLPEWKGTEQKGTEGNRERGGASRRPSAREVERFWADEGLAGEPGAFFEHFAEADWRIKGGAKMRELAPIGSRLVEA